MPPGAAVVAASFLADAACLPPCTPVLAAALAPLVMGGARAAAAAAADADADATVRADAALFPGEWCVSSPGTPPTTRTLAVASGRVDLGIRGYDAAGVVLPTDYSAPDYHRVLAPWEAARVAAWREAGNCRYWVAKGSFAFACGAVGGAAGAWGEETLWGTRGACLAAGDGA